VNLSKAFERLLLQVCAESKDFNTWKCLKVAARSACKRTPKCQWSKGVERSTHACVGVSAYRGSGVGKASCFFIASAEFTIEKTPIGN
jgi:hypothetical protein